MQSKGAIRFVAIILALVCLWELSFTAVTRIQEKKAVKYADKVAEAVMQSAAYGKVAEGDRAYYIDSVKKVNNRWYLDSIASEKVYMGYTFKKVREKDINLGLDLKGGMNVMLQVQLEDLVKALADNNPSPVFNEAVATAASRSVVERADFITLFADTWEKIGDAPLAQIFGTYELRDKIKPEFTNAQVISVIRTEAESAISNSFNVLRNRIDRFGVTQPNIQKIGNTGRILVELPGVKEPERVRKLLQGTASLEFWATFQNTEIYPYLQEANAIIAQLNAEEETEVSATAKASEEDILAEEIEGAAAADAAEVEAYRKANPLFAALNPPMYGGRLSGTACIGYANYADTTKINKWLAMPQIKALFPVEFIPMWGVKPVDGSDNVFELVAIKATSRDGKAPLDGGYITDARVQYSESRGGNPAVSMSMNAEGANIWAQLTKNNIGRQIAIVLDGMVYSYPTVQNEISGGNSEITGNFDLEEAEDLANVLKSGKLPAPATIIQEQVVGPSLGAESINKGLISFVLAFILVLIYMVVFYQGAGLVADCALLCNVLLLFGTLVSFGAVLTLPGIAGLVLTLGMAVDANVIIYERIKEELRAGKGLSKAIADGYSNAYSAIIDGQLTTLITGFVLFAIGSGPVKGFATTLIIGIITSVVTAIFISRLVFEDRLARGKNITFENSITKDFLQHTRIKFLEHRKVYYCISGALILIGILSICFKGFTYGVDFTGGRTFVVRFDKPVQTEDVRQATLDVFEAAAAADETVKNSSVEVKQFGGESQIKVTTSYKYDQESVDVDAEVEGLLYQALHGFFAEDISFADFHDTANNPNGIISSDKVGATIANDMKRQAIISVILALIAIFGYIAVRFKKWTWGLSGVISLAHTAFIVIGFFSLFSGILPFTLDVDSTFIAAILTIIGYAINDNVVIFDRIREYRKDHPKAELSENVNLALNATLSRTMNTSLTTLVTMIAIAIFGGEVIRGLAVALILGVVIGTYASICIGSTSMYDLEIAAAKRKAKKEGK
ncbi:MAG: protein translocase subunit SecDF [Bacteroidales bacterium]|nr:protein translocase subunit SecDF [Bacteroidales bacterium]